MQNSDRLIGLDACEMRDLLDRREISSVDLVRAHLDRILALDGRVRAFVTVLRDVAIAEAERCDEETKAGRRRGALHGLPITVKENIGMRGFASTLGVTGRASDIVGDDSALVRLAREAGAVVIGRTNVPQLLLSVECRNPLFGQTCNPWKLTHSPGGSSGGEAAAIAAGMSPLGLGTDIGGSIRVPATFAGIVGFKPSQDLWPMRGVYGAIPGQETVRSQTGPLARTVRDIVLLMSAIEPARASLLDPRVPPVAWPDPSKIDVARLRVGVFVEDGLVSPSASIKRAVDRAKGALTTAGCDVVAFTPPGLREAFYLWMSIIGSDGGATLRRVLGTDEPDVVLKDLMRLAGRSRRTLRVASVVARRTLGERFASTLDAIGRRRVEELWDLTYAIRTWRLQVLDALETSGIDALLCPAFATPAMPHGKFARFTQAVSFSNAWNAAQFPAGVVPVTRVRGDETLRPTGKDAVDRRAREIDEASAGLPVGVQIVARPWRDAVALALMAAIERGVCNDDGFPSTPIDP